MAFSQSVSVLLVVVALFGLARSQCGANIDCFSCQNAAGCVWCNESVTTQRCRSTAGCAQPAVVITTCPAVPSPTSVPAPTPVPAAVNCFGTPCDTCITTAACEYCNGTRGAFCLGAGQCQTTVLTTCPVVPTPTPVPALANCFGLACDACLNTTGCEPCQGFRLTCSRTGTCAGITLTTCPVAPTPIPVPTPVPTPVTVACNSLFSCDSCSNYGGLCDWCTSTSTGAGTCRTRGNCGGTNIVTRNSSQCSSIPVNECSSATSCDTCAVKTVNSTTTTTCNWCERTAGASCINGLNCNNGGTIVTNCTFANPCLTKATCGDCSATDGCSWCESDFGKSCQMNTTTCPNGQTTVNNCSAASTCFSHSDCTSCSADTSSCTWCPGGGGVPTCTVACNAGALTCPVPRSPVTAQPPSVATDVPSVVDTPSGPTVNPPTDAPTDAPTGPGTATSTVTSTDTTGSTVSPIAAISPVAFSNVGSPTKNTPPVDTTAFAHRTLIRLSALLVIASVFLF